MPVGVPASEDSPPAIIWNLKNASLGMVFWIDHAGIPQKITEDLCESVTRM
jgi:hypothetical protein